MSIHLQSLPGGLLFVGVIVAFVGGCSCSPSFDFIGENVVKGLGEFEETYFLEDASIEEVDDCLLAREVSYGIEERASTTQIYLRGDDGRRVAKGIWTSGSPTGEPKRIRLYSYDDDGNEIREQYYTEGAPWKFLPIWKADVDDEPASVITREYDDRGQLVEEVEYNRSTLVEMERYEYEDGHRVRTKLYRGYRDRSTKEPTDAGSDQHDDNQPGVGSSQPDFSLARTTIHRYEDGQKIRSERYDGEDTDGDPSAIITYSYDEEGELVEEALHLGGLDDEPTIVDTWEYDNGNRVAHYQNGDRSRRFHYDCHTGRD